MPRLVNLLGALLILASASGCGIKAMPHPPQSLNENEPPPDAGCFECVVPTNDR